MNIGQIEYALQMDIREEKVSVSDYLRMVENGDLVTSPEFQRNFIWDRKVCSQFIESVILNIPIPPIYLKKSNDGFYYIVDGLQRTTTLRKFLNDDFELCKLETLSGLNGLKYSELKSSGTFQSIATRISTKKLSLYVMQPSVPMDFVYDVFRRINTGGTILTRQEVRNCVLLGKSTRLLAELSQLEAFKKATANGISGKRLRDQECILHCLAFSLLDIDMYNGSMNDYLDRAMKEINQMSDENIIRIKSDFLTIMDLCHFSFGTKCFRMPSESNRDKISVAIMESVYYALSEMNNMRINCSQRILRQRYDKLLQDSSFRNACRNSTSDKTKVVKRLSLALTFLSNNI